MAGGVIRDAVDESGIRLSPEDGGGRGGDDFDVRLRKLHRLYKDGIITEEEYLKEKSEILESD